MDAAAQNTWKIGDRHLTDADVVEALLCRDRQVTKAFFYARCRPLFTAVQRRYYTDCEDVDELISEIYLYVMTPGRRTGRCKLEGFGFRCSLATWLKIVTEHYCHQVYGRKVEFDENISVDSDRCTQVEPSLEIDVSVQNSEDLDKVLASMGNDRYRQLIRLRYQHGLTNEETAQRLDMTIANYYNKHKLAKEQFRQALRKEGLI